MDTYPDGPDPEGTGPQEAELTCALEGCELPLPTRPLDEQGRRRAGRRPRYCSKAHADHASRQRRAAGLAAVTEPLAQAEALTERLLPIARETLDLVGGLVARLESAQSGALAQIAAAEAETAEARQDAAAAGERADRAERARREALAEVRKAAEHRDAAVREAAAVRQEADHVRSQAWEQVAAHERARGQSEAARQAAESALERLAAELRTVTRALDDERAAATNARARLAEAVQEAKRARTEQQAAVTAAAVLESARDETAAERDRLLVQLERGRGELAEARAAAERATTAAAGLGEQLARTEHRVHELLGELVEQRAQRALAEQRAEDARAAVESGEHRSAELRALLLDLRETLDLRGTGDAGRGAVEAGDPPG